MKLLKSVSMFFFLLALPINFAQAAQDHNSSRSNKTASAMAPDETEKLLKLSKDGAIEMTKAMIALDQQDGYTGEYEVTVKVGVSINRVNKNPVFPPR